MLWTTSAPFVWALLALAVFGAVSAIGGLLKVWRRTDPHDGHPDIGMLVLVQNQEHQIEGFLRTLAARIHNASPSGRNLLVVVDLGSTDQTPLIVERLAQRDSLIRVLRLPADRPVTADEAGMFISTGSLALLVDLRGPADGSGILRLLERYW